MSHKSPFLIIQELISPLQCEDIIRQLKHKSPNIDQRGNPTVTYKGNALYEIRISNIFKGLIPSIETYYSFEYKTLTPFMFEWYPTGYLGQSATCEGSEFVRRKGESAQWRKTKDYDFTVVVFLNDYNDEVTFDERFETRGGKLEFPTHDFGFNPIRGTAVIYPCCPNFVNAVSPIEAGESNILRFNIIAQEAYVYNQDDFPGGYMEWFSK